jgi:metallo-beta-lactamase class B
MPEEPFHIFGNTYYVGTHGVSSILVTSQEGHVLIDGGVIGAASQIAGSIETLGFSVQDVRWIVNSHAHYDHAGAIAQLQFLSGADIALSPWSARVLTEGGPLPDDPQFRDTLAVPTVPNVHVLSDGEMLKHGPLTLTAYFTPGHTPGGTSWTWQSCELTRCLDIVYADSLTAVSSDGFKFSASPDYPNAVADFQKSFTLIESLPCDILLVPHPDFADMLGKRDRRDAGEADPFVDARACQTYVQTARMNFATRLEGEMTPIAASPPPSPSP